MQSYLIIIVIGYLHSQPLSTRLYITYASLSFYCTIWNHPVVGYILVKAYIMIGPSFPSNRILYGPIIYTDNLSQGMASTYFAGKWPYFIFLVLRKVIVKFNTIPYFVSYICPIVMLATIGLSKIHSLVNYVHMIPVYCIHINMHCTCNLEWLDTINIPIKTDRKW